MKNFKAGQKVVYDSSNGDPCDNPNVIPPKNGEVVTLKSKSYFHEGAWLLLEYPTSRMGRDQSFNEINLHPLEDYFKEQTETIVEKLESELQIEIPELV